MPKRPQSRRDRPHTPLNPAGLRGIPTDETGPGGLTYQVQRVGPSEKSYVCPGCRHHVGPGIEHVVAWPTDAVPFGTDAGVAARRHWHSECWRRGLRPR